MGIEENEEMDEDYGSQLTAETPATIDINFILDERSREFYGEGYRWFDLVRLNRLESDLGFERKYNKLPIPAKERSLNKLLNQNSYWAN